MSDKCRACLSPDLELLFDLGPLPLAGGFLEPTQEAYRNEKKYPLPIHICKKCGLVQTTYVIPPDTLFENYLFSSSTVQFLVNHFRSYSRWLQDAYHPQSVIEFGCNDGVLLQPLQEMGIRTCGVDISQNITKIARDRGLNAITGYFNRDMAINIRKTFGTADIITGSNAFPHNDNPGDILEAAQELLSDNGHLVLEMMYAGSLLEKLQWDSMYHEHLSYFCLTTLSTLLERYGFHAVHAEIVPMHAGSLRVVATLNTSEYHDSTIPEMLKQEYSNGLTEPATWRKFTERMYRQILVVKGTIPTLSYDDYPRDEICAYGASGRASMWLNACKLDSQIVNYIVDESPLRIDKVMPGTHQKIVSPDYFKQNTKHYCIVTAWNYFDQIRANNPWFKGIWIVPAPELRFV
jgi:novobiocin biosynthesis protein NovU/D-mycarose 3-C-methyltransferase